MIKSGCSEDDEDNVYISKTGVDDHLFDISSTILW